MVLLVQMPTSQIRKPLMAARLVRVIAILFLAYTALGLSMPQLCCQEMGIPAIAETSARAEDNSVDTTRLPNAALSTNDYEGSLPSERPPSDENCFCCCAHVLPGRAVALVASPELTTSVVAQQNIYLPSPQLQSPYHPPRLT